MGNSAENGPEQISGGFLPVYLLRSGSVIQFAGRPLYVLEETKVAGYLSEDAFEEEVPLTEEELSSFGGTDE